MPKYYLQSGVQRLITQADNQQQAAVLAVHHWMADLDCIGRSEQFSLPQRTSLLTRLAVRRLQGTITVDQRGFRTTPIVQFDTLPIVQQWSRLAVAAARLERELSA